MDSEEHLIAARTTGVVRCRTVRRRPVEEQHDQQMLLAMQGTPWDATGRLATPIVGGGGALVTPAAATAASSGGAEGSTDRAAKTGDGSPEVEATTVPDDIPEARGR
eukprot:1705375-Amphidinium_carterae.1